jgi:hypothetical protein
MSEVIKVGLLGSRFVTIGPDFVDVSALTLDDVARGLSRTVRFAGQTPEPYSVARHSVILTDWLYARGHRGDILKEAMLHDAPEMLGVNDINTFVKRGYGQSIRTLEDRLMVAVYERFIGPVPPWVVDPIVHMLDKRLGAIESAYFGWTPEGFEFNHMSDHDTYLDFEFRASRRALDDADEWLARWRGIE